MSNYPTYDDIKLFYDWGCYANDDIRQYVELQVITKEEYAEITGEPFNES